MQARQFRLGDKVYCTKRDLNGIVDSYKSGYFTVKFEGEKYFRYSPEKLNSGRFLLFESQPKYKNVIYVDFVNKRIA